MKKMIIPILGLLGITIIFYFSFSQENLEKKEAQLAENIQWKKEKEKKLEEEARLVEKKRFTEEVKAKKQLEKLILYCKSKLYNLEGDFNRAKGALWDDNDELIRVRTRASFLAGQCKETSYSNDFLKLQKKCNKQLN